MDGPSRLPTAGEALLGGVAALVVAALVVFVFASPAALAPALVGLVLLGYALLKAVGLLVGRIIG